jgi:hypothetical protein
MVVYVDCASGAEACRLAMDEANKIGLPGAYVERLWANETVYVNMEWERPKRTGCNPPGPCGACLTNDGGATARCVGPFP